MFGKEPWPQLAQKCRVSHYAHFPYSAPSVSGGPWNFTSGDNLSACFAKCDGDPECGGFTRHKKANLLQEPLEMCEARLPNGTADPGGFLAWDNAWSVYAKLPESPAGSSPAASTRTPGWTPPLTAAGARPWPLCLTLEAVWVQGVGCGEPGGARVGLSGAKNRRNWRSDSILAVGKRVKFVAGKQQ